jgi:hypothetical protein
MKNTDMNNILQKNVFINIVKSYNKFKTFITSGEKIDYSYLRLPDNKILIKIIKYFTND